MLSLVKAGQISCIIVKDFTRFGRNFIDTGYFTEMIFPLFNVRFISVDDSFDTNDYKESTGGLETAFKYLIADYYSRDMSQKTKTAKHTKMKKGEYQSEICCYGYQKGKNGRLELDPNAAHIVKMIFEMKAAVHKTGEIVKALYDKKIPTPAEYKAANGTQTHDISRTNGIWQTTTIMLLLENETYAGTYIMGKRAAKEVGSNLSRFKPESEWHKIPNHHPAIVDIELFKAAQSQIKHFKIDKNPKDYPLKSKIICGCCKHTMQKLRNSPNFTCRFTRVNETAECYKLKVNYEMLKTKIFGIMRKQAKIILNNENLKDIKPVDTNHNQKSDCKGLIAELQDKKRKLNEKYVDNEITQDEYKTIKSEYDAELEKLQKSQAAITDATTRQNETAKTRQTLTAIATEITNETSLTQSLSDALINKVYIHPNNRVEIDWAIQFF
jgi:hypothetical protein